MPTQRTLAIIKPTAVYHHHTGPIIHQIEKKGFTLKQLHLTQLTLAQAQTFYKVHAQRFFYDSLCNYMSSGPIVVMVLEKENAITSFRELIGPTDPSQAPNNTIRKQFGTSIDHNAIHGSDAEETAQTEISFFFAQREIKEPTKIPL